MTAILGWSRFLQIGNIDGETMNNAIEAINRAAVAQAQLIDDVLDMSRIISGKLRLELQPIDVVAVINAAIETVRPTILAKQIDLELKHEEVSGLVWADPSRLQQAIWNLLTNAAKFTPNGGRISVEIRQTGKSAWVTVRDNGQGIDSAFLPHVFERFRQAESTTTRSHGGLGLGLAIVRYIVEMHGGHISAASEGNGKGAAFMIELPTLAGVTAAPPENTLREQYCDLSGMKVLYVDDEFDARLFVRAVLEHCGADVKDCPSAADAVIALSDWRPDVILTDIAMPGEDGNALVRQLNVRDWNGAKVPPIVALSACGVPKLESGFAEYLSKPIDPLVLAQAVRRAAR
jgi:CheY-like chemotaxis protein